MLIGIFVIAAIAVVIFVLMFLHPSVGDKGRILRVRFANIDKISLGTRVTFAGKPVGEVVSITELPDVETERKVVNGYVYVYELKLRVDSSVNVFNSDEISSRTSGLLGEKSVSILPHAPVPGEELRLVSDEILYATETASVEDTLKQFKGVTDKVSVALDNLNDAFGTLKDKNFWANVSKTAENLNDISTSLNHKDQWSEMLANAHQISGKLNTFSDSLNKSWDTVDKSLNDLADTTANTRKITANVSKGEGTVGRLVMKDDLYLKVSSLLSKGETVMNDVNHYGILFHLDKGWQRMRARRLNLLQTLSTPQQFRNYFNDEIDMVTTSLERVSMILDQMDGQPAWACYDLLQNTEFTKVYAELLRRITGLEEEIKMYNQQVVDTAVHQTELYDYCQ